MEVVEHQTQLVSVLHPTNHYHCNIVFQKDTNMSSEIGITNREWRSLRDFFEVMPCVSARSLYGAWITILFGAPQDTHFIFPHWNFFSELK